MSRIVITYGTYDLFHFGHEALLRHAKELGDYLIVGVTSDAFDEARGKFDVKQSLVERIHAVEATGLADKIIVEEYKGQKIDDIRKYHVDVFTVGSDWVGAFDYLKDYCEVVYLPRTQGVSSTELRRESSVPFRLACIGDACFTNRMVSESRYVGNLEASPIDALPEDFEILAESADAVYLSSSARDRSSLIRRCLDAGLHVLCEGPLADNVPTLNSLLEEANERGLVAMENHGVLYQPGFQRLRLLLESGVIGEIKDIDASYSIVPDDVAGSSPDSGVHDRMLSRSLLPAFAFLGAEVKQHALICAFENDYCRWVKSNLFYDTASATLKVGRGIKTEGDMVITGTKGYVYVPAPWWKLDYFEIRSEDLRATKKHYYECEGEGQRYILRKFCGFCQDIESYEIERPLLERIEFAVAQCEEDIIARNYSALNDNSVRFGGGETVTAGK